MKAYMIECRTGCSCCCNENHYRGFYKTEEEVNHRISYFLSPGNFYPLASQYAARGRYTAHEVEIEEISKGRFILNDKTLLHELNFLDLNEDGSIEDNRKERLYEVSE